MDSPIRTPEENAKARAFEASANLSQGNIGYQSDTKAYEEPAQESMSARLLQKAHRLRRDQRQLDTLNELNYLLEKNPEVARIMDLIDAVGKW